MQRLGGPDRGDATHIPDHRALRIEIGRYDKKFSAFGVLGRDRRKHVLAGLGGHELAEMRLSEQARPENSADDVRHLEQALSSAPCIKISQRRAVGRAEKRKWCNQ